MTTINSRSKGLRGEYQARDKMKELTKLAWDRTPGSGADEVIKGDLYIKEQPQTLIIEVKNYEDSPLNEKVLTNKTNYLVKWWTKLAHQADQRGCRPMLLFKWNRSKWYVATAERPKKTNNYMFYGSLGVYVALLEEWAPAEWKEYYYKGGDAPYAIKKTT